MTDSATLTKRIADAYQRGRDDAFYDILEEVYKWRSTLFLNTRRSGCLTHLIIETIRAYPGLNSTELRHHISQARAAAGYRTIYQTTHLLRKHGSIVKSRGHWFLGSR